MNTPVVFAAACAVAVFPPLGAAENGAPILRPFALMGNPAPVQMIVPGFVARELPVDLTNLNFFVYAPDGRLFAQAYDGNVYRLVDTDGDWLEDEATRTFHNDGEPTGGVGMAWGPGGLYLANRHRIVLVRERPDGSTTAETFAEGWMPPDGSGGRYLDVYGIAFDRAGNCFFGLGISDIRNAYRLDPDTHTSRYNRTWERGTIQRIPRDGPREIFATGVRYTVSLAFNAAGDLFASDQEGATWLFNGNPLDELLHIERGRHYGFPPRHPVHLPDVIDEPSVFDYAPQHQATCGVHFNEPHTPDAPVFGPAWWSGDAFVAAEARGRIYRTKLFRTAAGYVARNDTIAHLAMLTIDAVPTPQGDMLVTCHSGRPDWGTGPTGRGKLYKISYRDRSAPQPVFAHAASPNEWRVVFDRPTDPARFASLARHATITMGEYVSAGDRFESFRPGYQAVKDQQKTPRYDVPVLSAEVDADQRALILHTAPQTAAVQFSIGWRDGDDVNRPHDASNHELPQQAAVAVQADLTGVQARWRNASGAEQWSGWLPHPDLAVSRAFTKPSVEHARLFGLLREPGRLELQAQLDLYSMLHPAVQPGATLEYEYPPETVRVQVVASGPLDLKTGPAAQARRLSDHAWEIVLDPASSDWLPVHLDPRLDATWSTDEDARPRAFPLRRILLPWASRHPPAPMDGALRDIPELAGGNWERGRELFYGASACATCHQVNGDGGTVGPDLRNLVHRDYASVVQDIVEPSAALNPDYLAVTMQLTSGDSVAGIIVRNTSEHYELGLHRGRDPRRAARRRGAGHEQAARIFADAARTAGSID